MSGFKHKLGGSFFYLFLFNKLRFLAIATMCM